MSAEKRNFGSSRELGAPARAARKKNKVCFFVGMPKPEKIGNRKWAEFLGWEKTQFRVAGVPRAKHGNAPRIAERIRTQAKPNVLAGGYEGFLLREFARRARQVAA